MILINASLLPSFMVKKSLILLRKSTICRQSILKSSRASTTMRRRVKKNFVNGGTDTESSCNLKNTSTSSLRSQKILTSSSWHGFRCSQDINHCWSTGACLSHALRCSVLKSTKRIICHKSMLLESSDVTHKLNLDTVRTLQD